MARVPEPTPGYIHIGQIVGAFGIRGQVKVQPLSEISARFKKGARLRVRNEWAEIETVQMHKGRYIIKFIGVNDPDQAQALQWAYLEAPDERPELEEDEFLLSDLIGLSVVTDDGKNLGEVEDVLTSPAHEIIVVGEVMIPLVEEFILMIDWDEEQITVKLIPGMLPGEEPA